MAERSTIRAGLWGGSLGEGKVPTDDATSVSTVLKEIKIKYNEYAICTIEVFYENAKGRLGNYGPWGGTPRVGTWQNDEMRFATGEMLTSIEGTNATAHGVYCITSLTFKTNKQQQKTIGHVRGTKFSFDTPSGQIIGLYGRFGTYTDAIGIYLAPNPRSNDILTNENIIQSGLWGGPGGHVKAPTEGTVTRSTVLKQIVINYNQYAIRTFQFFYDNGNGILESPGRWGCSEEDERWLQEDWVEEKMSFDDGDVLTTIGGIYEKVEGNLVVTSLTFKTDKNKHKTIGHVTEKIDNVTGKEFSFGTTDGKIDSFYGRFGRYVDAIGFYLAPK